MPTVENLHIPQFKGSARVLLEPKRGIREQYLRLPENTVKILYKMLTNGRMPPSGSSKKFLVDFILRNKHPTSHTYVWFFWNDVFGGKSKKIYTRCSCGNIMCMDNFAVSPDRLMKSGLVAPSVVCDVCQLHPYLYLDGWDKDMYMRYGEIGTQRELWPNYHESFYRDKE